MSFPHEVIDALPTAAPADKELLRALLTRRFAYCLADDEAASDFVAKDPVSGIPPLNLIQGGTLFAYDETDTTTSASAVCLVTNDACRYKSGVVEPPYSVLSRVAVQPDDVDVSDGDTFLLLAGVTGPDFAGKAGQIAMRVGAKWHFAISPTGRRLYVEDEDRFYYRNASGTWTGGNGSLAFAANSIPITAIIGVKASFVLKVENQTTNAPPVSPVAPVAYIIGPSPTGAWSGKAGQLAACLVDGSYTYIVPTRGDEVFDKNLGINVKFDGTAWSATAGVWINEMNVFTETGSSTRTGTGFFGATETNQPMRSLNGHEDNAVLVYAAKRAGAELRFIYDASIDINSDNASWKSTVALFRDSESIAIACKTFKQDGSGRLDICWIARATTATSKITAPDALPHTYRIKVMDPDATHYALTLYRRSFSVEERA